MKNLIKSVFITLGIFYGFYSLASGLATLIVYGGLKNFYRMSSVYNKFQIVNITIEVIFVYLLVLAIFCFICFIIYKLIDDEK